MIKSFKHVDWRSPLHEYMFLYGVVVLKRPQKIFELGAARGLSAIVMAQAMRDWGVKGHVWTSEKRQEFCKSAHDNIVKYGFHDLVTVICGDGRVAAPKFAPYDLAFIDGNHDYDSVKGDFMVLKDLATDLVFHDSQWPPTPDVKRFVNECRNLSEYDIINLTSAKYDIDSCGFALFQKERK